MELAVEKNPVFLKSKLPKLGRLDARVSVDQKQLFQKAADLLGRPLTDFIISTLQEASLRVIKEHTIVRLVDKDQQALIQALMNPPQPNKRLIKAVEFYRRNVIAK